METSDVVQLLDAACIILTRLFFLVGRRVSGEAQPDRVLVMLCGHVAAGFSFLCVFPPSVSDVEDSEGLPSLDKPGWYSQGNWPHLHELLKTMTGKQEPKVGRVVLARPHSEVGLTRPLVFWHADLAEGRSQWCEVEKEERGFRQGGCVPACWGID